MTCIVFYEKPGCATNRLQKQLLRSEGLELEVRDLLSEPWTAERLRPFFGNLPVVQWFNPSAPAIKYGELDPSAVSAERALELMLAHPLLIRRPLLRCGWQHMAGFDLVKINALLPCQGNLEAPAGVAIDACAQGNRLDAQCPPPARLAMQ